MIGHYTTLSEIVLSIKYGDKGNRVGHNYRAVVASQQKIERFHQFKVVVIEDLYVGALCL